MSDDLIPASTNEAVRECIAFTRYLTGKNPDDYLISVYSKIRQALPVGDEAATLIDSVLLRISTMNRSATRISDAYSRIFLPRCLLRQRLIMVFAILENHPNFHRDFTRGAGIPRWRALLSIGGSLLAFGVALVIGMIVLLPVHVASSLPRRGHVA